MLRRVTISQPKQRFDNLYAFDPKIETWVVSDLKSKLALQRRLLESRDFIPEDSVLRASELWKKIFSRLHPQISLISQDLSVSLISEILKTSEYEWAGTAGAPQKMFDFILEFISVITHPEGHSNLGEWFREHVESYMRWGEWYVEGRRIYSLFQEKNWLPSRWMPGVLMYEDNLETVWKRPLIVDLSADLSNIESEILRRLSQKIECTIVEPNPSWRDTYETLLIPYETFHFAEGRKKTGNHKTATERIESRRFATPLSEVKDAVVQVREWIESGIKPERIAVLAANIKVYWRALDNYFAMEGIPLRGERTTVALDFSSVVKWVSQLRVLAREFDSEDIELSLFTPQKAYTAVNYDKFKSLYARVYESHDLKRDQDVYKIFKSCEQPPKGNISQTEFIDWAIAQWPEAASTQPLEALVSKFFRDAVDNIKLPVLQWLRYLENLSGRTDIVIEKIESGVHCENLDSADDLDVDAILFLGASDTDLRKTSLRRVDSGETHSIKQNYGFILNREDTNRLDFKLRWLLEGHASKCVLSVPMTDFNGSAVSPSLIWLEKSLEMNAEITEHTMRPRNSRWDSIQQSGFESIARLRDWDGDRLSSVRNRLEEDLAIAPLKSFNIEKKHRLSAHGIEDYLKCPFIYTARRLFKLEDLPEIDLDIDPTARGRLIHKIFEMLLKDGYQESWSDESLLALIHQARKETQINIGEERLWPVFAKRCLEVSKRFLDFEKQRRRQFPQTETLLCEEVFSGALDSETGEFLLNSEKTGVPFRGVIDRIDGDHEGNIIILDYKNSKSQLTQFDSWSKNNILQLGLYTLAAEKGLTRLGPRRVVAAMFYIVNPLELKLGYKIEGEANSLLDLEDKSKNKKSREEVRTFLEDVKTKATHVMKEMSLGHFYPNPTKVEDCKRCRWSQICRAPHLN